MLKLCVQTKKTPTVQCTAGFSAPVTHSHISHSAHAMSAMRVVTAAVRSSEKHLRSRRNARFHVLFTKKNMLCCFSTFSFFHKVKCTKKTKLKICHEPRASVCNCAIAMDCCGADGGQRAVALFWLKRRRCRSRRRNYIMYKVYYVTLIQNRSTCRFRFDPHIF